jgi:hypothetical protein
MEPSRFLEKRLVLLFPVPDALACRVESSSLLGFLCFLSEPANLSLKTLQLTLEVFVELGELSCMTSRLTTGRILLALFFVLVVGFLLLR